MKSLRSFKRGIAKARGEWLARHYDRALAEVSRLLKEWPDNPQLLVMWADLIQLQETDEGPSLADARAAYQRAAELDDQAPAALIELGDYQYAIEEDAKAASRYFGKAIALCKDLLKNALLGQAKALAELDQRSAALACLAEAYWLQSHNGRPGSSGDDEILARLKELAGT
jgi:tetratricopeptide (TPR) repeat protein